MEKHRNHIIKAVSAVTMFTVIAKMAGFIKQMVVASAFGTTIETDLIALAQGVIMSFDFFVTQALVTALVAVYINIKTDEVYGKKLIGDVYKVFIPLGAVFTLIFLLFSDEVAVLIAPSYEEAKLSELSDIIKMFSPVVLFQFFIAISSSVLTANKRFIWQQLVGVNQSVIMVLSVLLLQENFGVNVLIIGFCIAAVFNALFTSSSAKKFYKLNFNNPLKNKDLLMILRLMVPLLIGYSMIFTNQIVDKILSSGLDDGAVTALSYGAVLLNLVLTLITSAISVLFVYITSKIAVDDSDGASRLTVLSTIVLISIFLPISILVCFCSHDIVEIVYMRGAFDLSAVNMASAALLGYGVSIVPYLIRELFARLLYGYQDTKQPMINSSVGIIFNIIASIILCRYLGILGIALGSSISDIICALLNVQATNKKVNNLQLSLISKYLPLLSVGAVLCISVACLGEILMADFSALARFFTISFLGLMVSYLVYVPIFKPCLRNIKS